ncbi:hypothetical protein VNO77_11221 [Canavalia gladiata]|uniref:Uncharacterized protein n=1 Tax=Canavalia gladiata TaxID=3824 RepID=A0AAN9QXK6_CANGL
MFFKLSFVFLAFCRISNTWISLWICSLLSFLFNTSTWLFDMIVTFCPSEHIFLKKGRFQLYTVFHLSQEAAAPDPTRIFPVLDISQKGII